MRISDWSSDVCSSDLDEKNDRILIEDSSARSKASGGNTVTLSLLRARSRIVFAASLTAFASATARSSSGNSAFVSRKVRTAINAALRSSRSEEHTSELQSLMRISYAVFCLKKKTHNIN